MRDKNYLWNKHGKKKKYAKKKPLLGNSLEKNTWESVRR
jgi:hypothetical protein